MNLNLYTLCVIYLVYSFLGWVGETVVATAKGRRFTNRGVASGPFCFVGFNSKMVVTGDITQIDLPEGKRSGLVKVMDILKHVDDIEIHKFSQKDVVRHRLVQDIIRAYEKYEEKNK